MFSGMRDLNSRKRSKLNRHTMKKIGKIGKKENDKNRENRKNVGERRENREDIEGNRGDSFRENWEDIVGVRENRVVDSFLRVVRISVLDLIRTMVNRVENVYMINSDYRRRVRPTRVIFRFSHFL